MRSELPEVCRTRHHWIVLLRAPHRIAGLGLLGLFVWALLYPAMWIVLVVVLVAAMFFRWQTWRAEQIILTRKRIIRVQGVPETTSSEAFLRVDRISGIRIVQSVPGKLLDYATIELEAPGNHPDVRRMVKIWQPHAFYRDLRHLIFAEFRPDPDDVGTRRIQLPDDVTARLPRIDPPAPRRR
ncbi:MAG: hypothetical protein ACRDVG_06215 [Jatrophihabitantaceae bacterium]